MKKRTVSTLSLPVAVVVAYAVIRYVNHWGSEYAVGQPGIGFGIIGLEFRVITPAIIILALACAGLNYYIYSTTKAKSGDRSAAATRFTAAAVVVVCTLVLIPFIFGFGLMLLRALFPS